MATADDALRVLKKCKLRSASRIQNPGKYHFSIEFEFSEEMDYDILTRQLEYLSLRPSARRISTTYAGTDFEVSVRRPGSSEFNRGHAASIAFLLPARYVETYEDLQKRVSNR